MTFEFKGQDGKKMTGELIHKRCKNAVDFSVNKAGEFVFFCPECRGALSMEYLLFKAVPKTQLENLTETCKKCGYAKLVGIPCTQCRPDPAPEVKP
jgi:hypothetical protein